MVGDVVSRPGAGDAGSSTEDEPGVRHHVAAAPKGEALEKQADDLACIRDRAWAVCADRVSPMTLPVSETERCYCRPSAARQRLLWPGSRLRGSARSRRCR